MNGRMLSQVMLCFLVLTLVACGTPAAVPPTATPVPPTNTPIPPTLTPVPPTPTPEPTATPVPPTKVPSFAEKVDVGGYSLFIRCVGEGSPTVILEPDAGYANDMFPWSIVLQKKPTDLGIRVCHYNRAGIGSKEMSLARQSDPAPYKPRTAMDMAVDLSNLLTNAGIEGPYIMVGHIFGGWIARLFTDIHPDEVVGMVLIDGGHPDIFTRTLDHIPPPAADEPVSLTPFRDYYTRLLEEPLKAPEYLDAKKSMEQLHAVKPLGDLPLVVLSHDTEERSAQYDYMQERFQPYGAPFPVDVFNAVEDDWALQMADMAALSTNSTLIIVKGSSFRIPTSQPESVVEAIRIVLDAVRSE